MGVADGSTDPVRGHRQIQQRSGAGAVLLHGHPRFTPRSPHVSEPGRTLHNHSVSHSADRLLWSYRRAAGRVTRSPRACALPHRTHGLPSRALDRHPTGRDVSTREEVHSSGVRAAPPHRVTAGNDTTSEMNRRGRPATSGGARWPRQPVGIESNPLRIQDFSRLPLNGFTYS